MDGEIRELLDVFPTEYNKEDAGINMINKTEIIITIFTVFIMVYTLSCLNIFIILN